MMHGRNNGKKLMAVRIIAHCFEIVRSAKISRGGFHMPGRRTGGGIASKMDMKDHTLT